MHITETHLIKIIREEIIKESLFDNVQNSTVKSWINGFKRHPRDTDRHQALVKAWDMMCRELRERAPGLVMTPVQIAAKISQETGLEPNLIIYHLGGVKKLVDANECPSGQDLLDVALPMIDASLRRETEQRAEEDKLRVGGKIVRTRSPEGMGAGRPTYGHTQIGTEFAPDDLSDEDAVMWLKKRYSKSPMWAFDIFRDPDTNRIFAYYEIDTSG